MIKQAIPSWRLQVNPRSGEPCGGESFGGRKGMDGSFRWRDNLQLSSWTNPHPFWKHE
jgi:hypothetical protein